MKLIDDKGKLFGLINIIDFTTIVILGLLIFGGVKRLKSQPIVVDKTSEAMVTYLVEDIRIVTVENTIIGEPLYHYDRGEYIGEIEEVEYRPYTEPVEFNGEWVMAPIPEKYLMNIKVKANIKNNPDSVLVGGEQTRIGTQYIMKNKKISLLGTAIKVELLE